jgi:hypothetical protein
LVLHGGGWGIGSYQSVAGDLESTTYALDRVIHSVSEWRNSRRDDRYFMADPDWHPWARSSDGHHEFPKIGEVLDPSEIRGCAIRISILSMTSFAAARPS